MHLRKAFRRQRTWLWVCCSLALLMTAGCTTTGAGYQNAVTRAKNKVVPALVHIRPVKQVYQRGERTEVLAAGSGFIISSDGYVITNEHVAGEAEVVYCVLSDKEEVEADVVGVDPYTDIAVLKLKTDHPLSSVSLGDSDALQAGDVVMALGSPHGLARSVSLGIVSVTDRYLEEGGPRASPFNTWIQTDAAINPGNSGGPLVNLQGEVVGVNARMLRGAENVGFAIPINVAKGAADELILHGRVRRSWVGLTLQEMLAKTDDPSIKGVVIADVDPLSPARDAKIRPGDVLVAVNGQPVHARFSEDLPHVRQAIAGLPVGEETALSLRRGDETIDITVATEERSAMKGIEREFSNWGFTAVDVTPEIARRAQLPSRTGIVVSGVQVGGIAANAGLERGDIVMEVDNEKLTNLAHFSQIYAERVSSGKRLTLLLAKHGALTRFVIVKQAPEEEEVIEEGVGINGE